MNTLDDTNDIYNIEQILELVKVLKSDEFVNQKEAVSKLSELAKKKDERLIIPLTTVIDIGNKNARIYAADLLANYNEKKSFKSLIKVLSDPDEDVICAAIKSLGKIGNTRAINPIKKCIETSDYHFPIRELGESILKKKLHASTNTDAWPQHSYNQSIIESQIDEDTAKEKKLDKWEKKKNIKKLIKALKDADIQICEKAADALGHIGSVKAVKPLIKVLAKDSEKPTSLRKAAAVALGEIKDKKAIEALVCAAKEKNLRIEAVYALSRIPRVEARKAIQQYATDIVKVVEESGDNVEKLNAAYSLKFMDSPNIRAVYYKYLKTHIDRLSSKDEDIVNDAIIVLGTLCDLSVVNPLIVVLNTGKYFARATAATALGYIGGVEAKNALIGALADLGTDPAVTDTLLKVSIEESLKDLA